MPDGIRWNLNTSSPRTMVCLALLPPWKRITRSACSASRSTTFPFPSSPHWAPTITRPGMAKASVGVGAAGRVRAPRRHAEVLAPHRDRLTAARREARADPRSDLPAEADHGVAVAGAVQLGRADGH